MAAEVPDHEPAPGLQHGSPGLEELEELLRHHGEEVPAFWIQCILLLTISPLHDLCQHTQRRSDDFVVFVLQRLEDGVEQPVQRGPGEHLLAAALQQHTDPLQAHSPDVHALPLLQKLLLLQGLQGLQQLVQRLVHREVAFQCRDHVQEAVVHLDRHPTDLLLLVADAAQRSAQKFGQHLDPLLLQFRGALVRGEVDELVQPTQGGESDAGRVHAKAPLDDDTCCLRDDL
mmetsp:Transcript_67596/g.220035  ORF Transcript_67596/g.220035 Transcript_67596/m.220035 type:complete len:230 (+) Transcript_67596:927-1616(+)